MAVVQGEFWTEVFLKSNGAPYAGVRVEHYAAGTSTAKTVWTDGPMATPAAQPVVGDNAGRVSFYGDGDYRLVVKASVADGGATLYDWDPIKLTAKAATLRGENQGVSYPAATSANRGQLFAKTDGSGNITDLAIQKDTAFAELFVLGSVLSSIVQFGKGADLASAFTVVLGSDGNFFDVTGTANVTGLSSKPAGTVVWLRFTSACPLTSSGGFKLIGNQNYTTTANDLLAFLSLGSGSWEEVSRNGVIPVGGGGTGLISATLNGVLLGQGGNAALAVTAAGAASQVLAVGAGGGAPSFQQVTSAMIAAATITQSNLGAQSVGSGQIKYATGSASVQASDFTGAGASASLDVTMNDLSFFPSLTYSRISGEVNDTGSGGWAATNIADPGNEIGRVTLTSTAQVTSGPGDVGFLTVLRWKYITASDDPTIYVTDRDGAIEGLWVSDDPPAKGEPGCVGGLLVKAWDLAHLTIPEAALAAADERIAREGLKPQHRLYRALEVVAGGLPDRWIRTHCKVVDGALVMR